MLRRLIVIALVLATALFLMFIKNKVLVGEQEFQAKLHPVVAEAVAGKEQEPRAYTISFVDLAGNSVLVTATELSKLKDRLAGSSRQEPIKLAGEPAIVSDKTAISLSVPASVDETALISRVQGAPFKRPNEARDFAHLNFGIDIRGGVEFVCQLRNENGDRVAADEEVMHVLRSRLDERGLTEPVVTKLSTGDVQVVIPGGSRADAARTRKVLEDTGRLEFREILEEWPYVQLGKPDQPVIARAGMDNRYDFAPGTFHARSDSLAAKRTDPGLTPTHFYRLGKAALTGKDVADAYETLQNGERAVGINFNAVGAARNEAFTNDVHSRGNFGKKQGTGRIAIIFDGVVQSDPQIINPSQAHCVITGHFSTDEIDRLRTSLKAGSLAVVPEVISERVVGATLGKESVDKAMLAMLASFIIIAGFMWAYYGRHLGTVANICLVITAAIIYATLGVFDATLTLPGLAGLVLIIGMAVDTNILVFERIREEQAENKGLLYAIEHGYGRAFWTIVDAHLTTFATALVLYVVGSGPVRGFGLTLMIGILVNLFSGIYAGRLFTDWLCRGKEHVKMASWVPALRLPYVEWRWFGYSFSVITAVLGILYFAFGHKLHGTSFESKFDIDFTGGNMVQMIFQEPHDMSEVQTSIKKAYDQAAQDLNLLNPEDLRMQAYFATLGESGKSRQWVFRGRDEKGSALEAERDANENIRVKLQRTADKLRSENKDAEAKKIDKEQIEPLNDKIKVLQVQVRSRTDEFKRQLAAAFPGQVSPDGAEVLASEWKDAVLTLQVATLTAPDQAQCEGLRSTLSRRVELAAIDVKPLEGKPGFSLAATYRQKPGALATLDLKDDPLAQLMHQRFITAGASVELANVQTKVALDIYSAAANQAAKERLTVAKSFPSSEHFSGQVAGQMKLRALIAVLVSLVAILAYVAARFEFRFGVGAVTSLFHDVILTTGIIVFLGLRIDLTVIAAILTIIGYSINDTIVTFDRIRENLRKHKWPLAEAIDISIAQTMARTVLTTGTVFITVFILWMWGGDSLYAFNSTLLIGIFLGTYSSVFVAAPIIMAFTKDGEMTLVESHSDEDAGRLAVEAQEAAEKNR